MVLEEDGTEGDGIPADAVVVDGEVEGGGSSGAWKEIIEWLCRTTPAPDDLVGRDSIMGMGSIGMGRQEGTGAASDSDEISLQSIVSRDDELHLPGGGVRGLTTSPSNSNGGERGGGGGGGTGTGTAFVRMPCCGGGRITPPPPLLTKTCASTVMGTAADPGSVLESLWQSETLPSAALLRTSCCCCCCCCCCRTGGGGGGARG